MNLIDTLQQHFNYPPLQKISPNTQEVKKDEPGTHAFSQAAIPVVLIGLYKFTRTDPGAESIIHGEISSNWVETIFTPRHKEIIKRVADYSDTAFKETGEKLNDIASKAVELIKSAVAPDYKPTDVKDFMSNERNHILLYLPAVLQTGDLMNDATLDDRTHKMEGPISSLMHAIGSGFSGSEKGDDVEK